MKLFVLFVIGTVLFSGPASAGDIVADLSSASIAVNTGFTGTTLTVFGVVESPGELMVAIEGPDAKVTVRHKGRHLGLWVPDDSVSFDHAPQFFSQASIRPLPSTMTTAELAQRGLVVRGAEPSEASIDPTAFQEALVRVQQARGLYNLNGGKIQIKSGKLFRADFPLPVNVPIGAYRVHIALIRDGALVAARTLPLTIDEDGISAFVQKAAFEHPFLYAVLSLGLALGLGAGTGVLSLARKGD